MLNCCAHIATMAAAMNGEIARQTRAALAAG